jgi:phage recombination protein Bet
MNDERDEQPQEQSQEQPKQAEVVGERELPAVVKRRGVSEAQWLTLCNNLYPGANPKSVLMVLDYCAARKLDPMKKPCHIVPMSVKDARTGKYEYRDVVMPGIYEFRTTAHRTGDYLGHSRPEYGPVIDVKGVSAPEWCEMTIYRLVRGTRVEFPVRCYFREVVVLTKDGKVNDRWTRAPIQMTTKCTEAAGIREAFPEEVGGEHTEEEMAGRVIDMGPSPQTQRAPVLQTFDKLSEAVQDAIERAFAGLSLSEAQRLVKLTEYIGGDADPELGSVSLLKWCVEEGARRKQPVATKGPANGKAKTADGLAHSGAERHDDARDPTRASGGSVAGAPAGTKPADPVPVSQAVAGTVSATSAPVSAAEIFGAKDTSLGF